MKRPTEHWAPKRSAVFYQYLFSYALAFFFPMFLLGSFFYGYVLKIYQQEIVSNAQSKLSQTMSAVDVQLDQIEKISQNIFANPALLPFYFENDTVAGITAIAELKKYLPSDSLIFEVVFYDGQDGYLFSSQTSYTIDNYFKIHQYDQWSSGAFLEEMKALPVPAIRSEESVRLYNDTRTSPERIITFLYPDLNPYLDRRVMILVKSSSLYQLQQNAGLGYDANTFLLNPDGKLVAGLQAEGLSEEDLAQVDLTAFLNEDTLFIGGKKYLYLSQRSPNTHWRYVTLIDSADALQDVKSLQRMIVGGFSLLFLLGLMVTILLANRSYAPLRRIRSSLKGATPESHNEFDLIDSTIRSMKSQNQHLTDQLEASYAAVKDYLVYALLKGAFSSVDEFNRKGEAQGMSLSQNIFQVATFYSKQLYDVTLEDMESFISMLASLLPEEVQGFWRDYTGSGTLVLIVCLPSESTALDFIFPCQYKLQQALRSPVTVGISQIGEISEIPKLYLQAMAASDYRLLRGADQVIRYDDINQNPSIIDQSFQNVSEKLGSLIRKGKLPQVENLLVNTVNYMKSSNTSIFYAKLVCYNIISTVIQTFEKMGMEHHLFPTEYPNIFLISSLETVDELIPIIKKVSADMQHYLKPDPQEHQMTLIDQMTVYIQEHYASVDFSLQGMAETFHMSAPNLSAYFKRNTNMTLMDYVTQLKIGKAKELLLTGSMPLRDIALEVGYYNQTSFIRRFKQLTGMTPGEYRSFEEKKRFLV